MPVELANLSLLEDVKLLLDHLGVEQTFLVAQSMGGRACLGFALANPERTLGLVLGDPTGGASDQALVEAMRGAPAPRPGLTRMLAQTTIEQRPNIAFLYSEISGLNPPRPTAAPGNDGGPTAVDLKRLAVPTLLIVGEEDAIAPVKVMQTLQGLIPSSRLEVVPGAAHSTYFEQPAEFNRLVEHFFAQVLAGSTAVAADD